MYCILLLYTILIGPSDFGGWSYKLTLCVRHSVPLSMWCFLAFFQTAPRIFPIFWMSVEDNRAPCLSQMIFLKKFFILDYRGLSVTVRRGVLTPLYFWSLPFGYPPLKDFLIPPFQQKFSTRSIMLYILKKTLGACSRSSKRGVIPLFLYLFLKKSWYAPF